MRNGRVRRKETIKEGETEIDRESYGTRREEAREIKREVGTVWLEKSNVM